MSPQRACMLQSHRKSPLPPRQGSRFVFSVHARCGLAGSASDPQGRRVVLTGRSATDVRHPRSGGRARTQECTRAGCTCARGDSVRAHRRQSRLTQSDLAKLVRSSQSRVAKMESGDPSVSLDLLVRTLLALGVSNQEIARTIAPRRAEEMLRDAGVPGLQQKRRRPMRTTGSASQGTQKRSRVARKG